MAAYKSFCLSQRWQLQLFKSALLNTDLKPIALPPITCITPIGKCIINVMQTPGGKYNIVM